MSDITTKKEALAAIQKTKPTDTKPKVPKTEVAEDSSAPVPTNLQDFQLPELTHEFNAESPRKKRRRLPLQIMVIGGVIFMILALIHALTSGDKTTPKPAVASNSQQNSIGIPESDKDALIKSQAVRISELEQQYETGKVTNTPGQKKPSAVPQKPIVVPKTPKSTPQIRRTPSSAHRVTRPIRVRRAAPQPQPQPQPVAAKPPAPSPQPQPVAAKPQPQPAANFSLTKSSAHAPKPQNMTPIKISSSRPLNRSLVNRTPTASRQSTVKAPPQGVLVASLTGDLLQDNQSATDSPVATDSSQGIYPTPESSLGKGLIAAGTTVKAKLDNPVTWPQNSDAIIGQRYLLTLTEDLGAMAKKGSKVVAQVTTAEGDFVSMQVVEINQQAIEHVDLTDDSPEARKTPVAIVQYKQSPYLQAKLKGQGEGFGNKLLRAGLNAGIDQLRSSNVGDRASSLVEDFAPSRSGSRSRNGLYHFDKEVEIYFSQGV